MLPSGPSVFTEERNVMAIALAGSFAVYCTCPDEPVFIVSMEAQDLKLVSSGLCGSFEGADSDSSVDRIEDFFAARKEIDYIVKI